MQVVCFRKWSQKILRWEWKASPVLPWHRPSASELPYLRNEVAGVLTGWEQWEKTLISWHYGPVLNTDREGCMLAAGCEADVCWNSKGQENSHSKLTVSALPSMRKDYAFCSVDFKLGYVMHGLLPYGKIVFLYSVDMRIWPMKCEQKWCVQLFSKRFKSHRICYFFFCLVPSNILDRNCSFSLGPEKKNMCSWSSAWLCWERSKIYDYKTASLRSFITAA